jgi:hypothetical protein
MRLIVTAILVLMSAWPIVLAQDAASINRPGAGANECWEQQCMVVFTAGAESGCVCPQNFSGGFIPSPDCRETSIKGKPALWCGTGDERHPVYMRDTRNDKRDCPQGGSCT